MRAKPLKLAGQAVAIAAIAALLALLVWKLVRQTGGVAARIDRGHVVPAPDFTLARIDQPGTLRLSSLRGTPVVINFWASWCQPCKQEAPLLVSAARAFKGSGVRFVGIDAQDFKTDARRFMRRYGIDYPVVHDGPGATVTQYGVTGFPETFFVDAAGKVVAHISGGIDGAAQLRADIRKALGA